jgi:hypothetical protein
MRSRVRRQCYYDARVNDIHLRDITSSEKNVNILRALRDEPNDCTYISLLSREVDEDPFYNDFVIREGDDLGWLGYFIGTRSTCLDNLRIFALPEERERIDALMEGIARIKTIKRIHIETDLGVQGFESLGLLMANKSLNRLELSNMNIGSECAQSIASALSQMQHHGNVYEFYFRHNGISIEDFAVIFGQLASHRELVTLCLEGSTIGRNGGVVVGNMLSSWDVPHLQSLFLVDSSIDDRGLQALVKGMSKCVYLTAASFSGNRSITAAGLRSLSTLFQSENCALEELYLKRMNIGDDGAAALADGLVGNKSLQFLFIDDPEIANITSIGWSAFSKLLCDTSSTNSTYLSNHTLQWIGFSNYRYHDSGAPRNVKIYLDINFQQSESVGTWKILRHHLVFDMMPLFQWKLKFLPLVAKWFESVGNLLAERGIVLSRPTSFESRKLSAVYQFVRGMPMLVIHGYKSRRTNTRMSRKRRLDGETK